ncbi:hypothetical protein MNBD_DELTA03-1052 [hydrothermal vent metagenome]|uniref:Uncharacterized protein n=1 Tax=hydrothermal vent metagenome TaxID=652676 RepID=A0A3B0VL42_9ZZZZ
MAEIKSTMEMVMARAARMCAEAADGDDNEDARRAGMRAGGEFIAGKAVDLNALMDKYQGPAGEAFRQGLASSFMRNINLPRHAEEDGIPAWEGALSGIMTLAAPESRAELGGITGEIRNILARYLDHKKQLRQQLEDNFAMQTAQLQQNLAQQTGMQMNISPAQHPEFQKEWQKVMEQMNDQYLNALEQYKDAIYKILAINK